MRLIDADELKNRKIVVNYDEIQDTFDDGLLFVTNLVDKSPTVDAVPVVRCNDCKHRPTKPEKYNDGFDLAFPDEVCPCYCDGDPFYSRYPKDNWFCPNGERKGGN